mgnify:FL=1|jgi:hypothetical protein
MASNRTLWMVCHRFLTTVIVLIGLLQTNLRAQDLNDLLRYGRPEWAVTARSAGMGGANGSLVGDYGSVLVNPAALGGIRRLTWSATLGARSDLYQNTFLNDESWSSQFRLPLQDLSLMFPVGETGDWDHVLGMGFSQNRNFAERIEFTGYNTNSSLLHHWADDVNRSGQWNDYGSGLAYDAGLLGPVDTTPNALIGSVLPNAQIQQSEERLRRGRQSELSFHWSAAYQKRWNLGLTMGIRTLRYRWNSLYREEDINNKTPDFESFDYKRQLDVTGSGIFWRLGLQGQPLPWLRIGMAYSGRERSQLEEDYRTGVVARWVNPTEEIKTYSPNPDTMLPFVWNYRGSNRTTLSAAVFWGKKGLLSLDYDWIGYRNMGVYQPWGGGPGVGDFWGDLPDWAVELNRETQNMLRVGQQLRLGTEWIAGLNAFRMGYQWSSSPFARGLVDPASDQRQRRFTLGAGRRNGPWVLDVAAYLETSSFSEELYPLSPSETGPVMRSTLTRLGFMTGIQYRFGL